MANMRDVVAYFCRRYPHQHELSNGRLTKMVYLADWRSAILRGHQLTDAAWYFDHYGPYVHDVLDSVRDDPYFEIQDTENMYGGDKILVEAREGVSFSSLSESDRKILDFVIEKTAPLYWEGFIKLVYSTYPVLTQPRYTTLDLVGLAQRYKREKSMLVES